MLIALLITVGSVLAGAAVGALTNRRSVWLSALRTFSVAAVVSGVMVQLLPESVAELGGWALLVFVAALAMPALLAPVLRRLPRSAGVTSGSLGVDLGFLGFVVHQAAEGLALGTYAGPEHGHHGHDNIVLAMAAHTVPLTAVVIATALAKKGKRSALRRTILLAGATIAGFALADLASHRLHHDAQPWLSAAVAGLLCHVILHDAGPKMRRSHAMSGLDVLAAAAGVLLPIWAAQQGATGHGGDAVRLAVGDAFVELLLETGPMLLLGLVIGAGLQMLGSRVPSRYFTSGGPVRQALRGIAVGAPLPLCACGVLPIADSLRKRGAGPAMVVAFLIATPELGPETLTLTVRFLGWPFAIARLVAALALAFAAALLFARLARPSMPQKAASPGVSMTLGEPPAAQGPIARAYGYFDELLLHIAPWAVVGLIAAAYVEAVIPAESLVPLADSGLDVIVIALIAMPSYVCAASATPLAAVLLLKGASPGAVLVGLLLGPATNIATIGVLRKGYGKRAVVLGILGILAMSVALAYAVNLVSLPTEVPERLIEEHSHGWPSLLAVGILGVSLVAQLWRWGMRSWFEILDVGGGSHQHQHVHDPGHSPAHGHSHSH